jgi:hypothetical protein
MTSVRYNLLQYFLFLLTHKKNINMKDYIKVTTTIKTYNEIIKFPA